jgi:hypothetical protein
MSPFIKTNNVERAFLAVAMAGAFLFVAALSYTYLFIT